MLQRRDPLATRPSSAALSPGALCVFQVLIQGSTHYFTVHSQHWCTNGAADTSSRARGHTEWTNHVNSMRTALGVNRDVPRI